MKAFGYDPMGRVAALWQHTPSQGTSSVGIDYNYGLLGDEQNFFVGNSIPGSTEFVSTYSPAGRLTSFTTPTYDDATNPANLLIVLSLSVYACAQEGTVEHRWTDKNNTEMYAAYMLQGAYSEQGYCETKVEIRQAGTKRIFVLQPGRIYHVGCFDVSGLGDLPEEAMTDSPKAGDVYSPDRGQGVLPRLLVGYIFS